MVALMAAGVAGCGDVLIQRVSNEFECAPARVNVLERHDIADNVYDVEACGRRGRYSCVGGGRGGTYGCVHEQDPPKWDPDPALVASLPGPSVPNSSAPPPSTGQRRLICGPQDDGCVFNQNGAWRWRPATYSSGGCDLLCQ